MKKILLIITGSIAAYKALDLIRLLRKKSYQIIPIISKGGAEFVTALSVGAIANSKVYCDLFPLDAKSKIDHINLSRMADLIVIAPASADIIAKMAGGLADDLASATLLAANKPIFIAPAMNEKMWLNLTTQKNITKLRENGAKILPPQTDNLICGEFGAGKMIDIEQIFLTIDNFFNRKKIFAGKKIIVTAGASFEPIDSVRFIGNYSSGKQGIAIAEEFFELGAEVTLIAANITLPIALPKKNIINVKTADEIFSAVNSHLLAADIFISCAAISDFRPKNMSTEKIKKTAKNSLTNLELIENIDILKTIGTSLTRPKIVVGFAAEDRDLLENATNKLKEKNCDLIVANNINIDGDAIFGSDYNQVSFLDKSGKIEKLEKMTKSEVAEKLAQRIAIITPVSI